MSRSAHKSKAPKRAAKARDASNVSDPIFPAIKAHEAACNAIMAYCNRREDVPRTLTHDKELRALARTTPRTPEGVRALGSHVAKWWDNFFNDVADPEIKRVFQSLARAMPAHGISQGPDPIYGAITAHDAAWREYEEACKTASFEDDDDSGELQRLQEMARTIPTTLQGIQALAAYVESNWDEPRLIGTAPAKGLAKGLAGDDPKNSVAFAIFQALAKIKPASTYPKADPIFAALIALQGSELAFSKACVDLDNDTASDKSAWDEALRKHEAAIEKVCRTVPETVPGLLALVEYIAAHLKTDLESSPHAGSTLIEAAFSSVTKAINRLARA